MFQQRPCSRGDHCARWSDGAGRPRRAWRRRSARWADPPVRCAAAPVPGVGGPWSADRASRASRSCRRTGPGSVARQGHPEPNGEPSRPRHTDPGPPSAGCRTRPRTPRPAAAATTVVPRRRTPQPGGARWLRVPATSAHHVTARSPAVVDVTEVFSRKKSTAHTGHSVQPSACRADAEPTPPRTRPPWSHARGRRHVWAGPAAG